MKCSRCGLFNPDSSERCDCGFNFRTQTVEESYSHHGGNSTTSAVKAQHKQQFPSTITSWTKVHWGRALTYTNLFVLAFNILWISLAMTFTLEPPVFFIQLLFGWSGPMALLGVIVSVTRPRQPALGGVNGLLALFYALVWFTGVTHQAIL